MLRLVLGGLTATPMLACACVVHERTGKFTEPLLLSKVVTIISLLSSGCKNYEPPNATHIVSNDTDILEGETFSISCLFNGDVSSAHYDIIWSLDFVTLDLNPNGRYNEVRNVNCPSSTPCCSFTGVLEVANADTLDSGLYACTAVPVTIGKGGSSLSLYISE